METGESAAWGRGGAGQNQQPGGTLGRKGDGGGLTALGVLYQSWKQIKATPPSPKKTCGKVTSETDLSGAPGWCSQLNGPTPGFGSGGAVILGGRDSPCQDPQWVWSLLSILSPSPSSSPPSALSLSLE